MVFIQGKCYLMCLRENTENEPFVFKSEEHKILVMIIDSKLAFKGHAKNLCKKSLAKNFGLNKSFRILNDAQKTV